MMNRVRNVWFKTFCEISKIYSFNMVEVEPLNQIMKRLDLLDTGPQPPPWPQHSVISVTCVVTATPWSSAPSAWTRASAPPVMRCITNIQSGLVTSER